MLVPEIVFEDEDLLVLDKPAGMVVNKADTTSGVETVQDWIDRNFKFQNLRLDREDDFVKRSGIVHRIDKETSGLLLVAKTPEAFKELQRQFKAREVGKKYLALVEGDVKPKKGEINAPVGRLPWNRERFGVFPGGKDARTEYLVLSSGQSKEKEKYSLLELTPHTGRTHQIRVHLKYLGFPIVGDSFYAGRKQSKKEREWCPRLFLHAFALEFKHPEKANLMAFKSELPDDLNEVLKILQKA